MKINFLIVLLFLNIPSTKFSGKVIGVLDGDTIEVLVDQEPIRIRLNGIDCPEKSQDYGTKAKQFTSDLCFNKNVKVISFGTDRYGRTLGDIVLEDGRILNQELVRAGLAWHYKKYSKDEVLATLEIKAREQKQGLWLLPQPIAPWDFRHK